MKKKIVSITALLLLCINLISCGGCCDAWTALQDTFSGDIIDPIGDFSRGSEENTFIFGGKNYILIDDMHNQFCIPPINEEISLGWQSNYPFGTSTLYRAFASENPEYILSGQAGFYRDVYMREDLCKTPFVYVLSDCDYEFDFSTDIFKTDEISQETHPKSESSCTVRIAFYLKEYPNLVGDIFVYQFDGKWYYIRPDLPGRYQAYAFSEDFLKALIDNDLLPQ